MFLGCNCFNFILSGVGGLLGLAGFIMMHVVRLRHSGRFCAGDDIDSVEKFLPDYGNLHARGKYLLGYLIFFWVMCGLICVAGVLACLCGRRR